jgi:hypothetical protein
VPVREGYQRLFRERVQQRVPEDGPPREGRAELQATDETTLGGVSLGKRGTARGRGGAHDLLAAGMVLEETARVHRRVADDGPPGGGPRTCGTIGGSPPYARTRTWGKPNEQKNLIDGCSPFLISFSPLNPSLILRGKASWRENMVATVETVFHAVDGFGDRYLAEEELCRTKPGVNLRGSRIFVEESLMCKEAGSI